jgi:hypothetical protein
MPSFARMRVDPDRPQATPSKPTLRLGIAQSCSLECRHVHSTVICLGSVAKLKQLRACGIACKASKGRSSLKVLDLTDRTSKICYTSCWGGT